MFKGIKNLYIINGKLVFRAHFREKEREKYVWKTIGKPDDFTTKELEKIVSTLMKSLAKENQIRQERKNNYGRKETSSSFSHRTEPKKTKSNILGEIVERFLRWYKSVRESASYRKYKTSSKPIIKFFGSNNINLQESHQTYSSQRHCDICTKHRSQKKENTLFEME